MSSATINIALNPDEAIVLFEFLRRYSDKDELKIEDQAEQRVLWNICCSLEKVLEEPFSPDYGVLLEASRSKTRDDGKGF